MGPAEMERIADLFAAVLVDGRNVKAEALELRAGYQQIHYCFGEYLRDLAPLCWRSTFRRWTGSSGACCGSRRASCITRTACARTARV